MSWMDIVIRREEMVLEEDKVFPLQDKKKSRKLAFELFQHKFVNDDEKKVFIGPDENSEADGVFYMFKMEPPINGSLIFSSVPMSADEGSVFTYIIFLDVDKKKVGIVCSQVVNEIEYGSKHITLANTLRHDKRNLIFVQAGEMQYGEREGWTFNHFSGTFTQTRREIVEEWVEFIGESSITLDDINNMRAIADDWGLTRSLLGEISPYIHFEFSSRPFEKESLPLTSLIAVLDSKNLPYVVPNVLTNTTPFKNAVEIIGTFSDLKRMTHQDVRVSATATEDVGWTVDTSAGIHQRDLDSQVVGRHGRTKVSPFKDDLKKALLVVRAVGAKKLEYGKSMVTVDVHTKLDLFQLVGREFTVRWLPKYNDPFEQIVIKVDKVLGVSNNTVYKCTVNGESTCVLKVESLYPFNATKHFSFIDQARVDSNNYGTKVHTFLIPGSACRGTILPYLGKTITEIPLEERLPMFKKFKGQYFTQFNKTIGGFECRGGSPYAAYNDVKPANTTMDSNGNFHLIDFDRLSNTPSFYGPTDDRTYINQMFGVLLVMYWFKTNKKPFAEQSSPQAKLDWVYNTLEDIEIKEMFLILLDTDIAYAQKRLILS